MAEQHHQQTGNASGRSLACATLAGVAFSAPLLGMMGFTFLATLTLLAITSPLLLIFSPLLVMVGFLFAGALAGFTASAAMAFAGFSALAFMYREIKDSPIGCSVAEWFAGFGNQEQNQEKEWGGYFQLKGQEKENAADNPTITSRG